MGLDIVGAEFFTVPVNQRVVTKKVCKRVVVAVCPQTGSSGKGGLTIITHTIFCITHVFYIRVNLCAPQCLSNRNL